MTAQAIYLTAALLLFSLGLTALLLTHHLIRKVLALNVMASAVFLLLVVIGYRPAQQPPTEPPLEPARSSAVTVDSASLPPKDGTDPVPHALVLTGIVVSFSASALAVALSRRVHAVTGEARLPEEQA
ncbi:MAG: NADH-quinone oxidoreductase subunit K [Trueperaceae bacterium]